MDTTIYASRVGMTPSQITQAQIYKPTVDNSNDQFIARANQLFGSKPYVGSAQRAPHLIYGGYEGEGGQGNAPLDVGSNTNSSNVVMGNNIQPDIPTGNEAPLQSNGPSAPADTLPLQQAGVSTPGIAGQDMAPANWKYDKAPSVDIPKTVTPEHVAAGKEAINYAMQNNMPPAASPVQAQTQAADQDRLHTDLQKIAGAKNPKTEWKNVQKDPFYKNSDFYTGMMNVGLAIMSGANPMEAFQAGKGAMDKATLSTQLGGNRQALVDQGYSPASVEAAITSGDTSKLQMQQMSDQDRMQAQNENWVNQAQYSQDLADQNYARARADQLADQATAQQNTLQQQKFADERAQRNADNVEARQKRLIDYRADQKVQAAKTDADNMIFSPKEVNSEAKNPDYTNVKTWSVKNEYFNAANNDLQQTLEAKADYQKTGDEHAASKSRSGYMQSVINAARGEIGDGARSLQIDDLSHFAEDPSIFVKKGGEWALKAGFTPTDAQIDYLKNQIETGGKTARQGVIGLKKRRIDSLGKTYGAKKATAFVNKVYGGEWYDPYNQFDTKLNDNDRLSAAGALSSGSVGGFNF